MQPYQPAGDTAIANLGGTGQATSPPSGTAGPKMLAMLAGLTATG